jgi:mono/diheme cytochrome c family protein
VVRPDLAQVINKRLQATVLLIAAALAAAAFRPSGVRSENGVKIQPQPSDGAKVFENNCVECHGKDGRGLMLHQPDFTNPDWQNGVSDEEIFKVIKWGREPMPFWAGSLNDEQISATVKFIRSLRGTTAAAAAGPPFGPKSGDSQITQQPAGAPAPATQAADGPGSVPILHAPLPDGCIACHQKQTNSVPALYSDSIHFKSGKSCNACHGGDTEASDKQAAHSLNFIGQPTTDQSVRMCGACHRSELALYKTSHHFPEHKNVARVDCVQCHGAHTVGSPKREFSFAYFCSGCHGQEYLPGLGQQFQDLLKLWDDVTDSMREMEASGRHPSDALLQRRKEIQGLTSDIVHRTDLQGGTGKIPHILELGDQFKQMIVREKGQK